MGALRPRRAPPGARPRHRRRRRVAHPGVGDAAHTGGHRARPRHRLRGAGAARVPARPRRHRHGRRPTRAGDGPGDVRAQRPGRRAARRAVAGSGRRAPVRPDRLQPAVRPRPGAGRLRLPRLRAGGRRRARRAGRRAAAAPGARRAWRSCSGRGCTCAARTGRTGSAPGCPRASTRGSCSGRSPTRRCTSAPGSATRGSTCTPPRPARRPGRGSTGWRRRRSRPWGSGS